MTLPTTGLISLSMVNTELGLANAGYLKNSPITLNDAAVRKLAGVLTGPIFLSNLRGKSAAFVLNVVIAVNTLNFNLAAELAAAGWDGVLPVIATVTVSPGVYLGSSSTSVAALVGCALPLKSIFTIAVNGGFIYGCPGEGGAAGTMNANTGSSGGDGGPGGPAISLGYPTTIICSNGGAIGGGGGGGGGGGSGVYAESA